MQLCDFIVTSRLTNCLLHEMEMSYKNKKNSPLPYTWWSGL